MIHGGSIGTAGIGGGRIPTAVYIGRQWGTIGIKMHGRGWWRQVVLILILRGRRRRRRRCAVGRG